MKSFITSPSPGLVLKGPGFYEISGIAYSGNGRIAKVMVSADGGKSWGAGRAAGAGAAEGVHALPHAVALGRRAGDAAKPRLGRSRQRAADARARSSRIAARPRACRAIGGFPSQHYNTLTSWAIERNGEVKHVYA